MTIGDDDEEAATLEWDWYQQNRKMVTALTGDTT